MTTSAGLSCEAFENAMVCNMQPKCSEMRLRCGGRVCRRCGRGRWPSMAYKPAETRSIGFSATCRTLEGNLAAPRGPVSRNIWLQMSRHWSDGRSLC